MQPLNSINAVTIGSRTYRSRLLVGTGKYKDFAETGRAIEASGAEIVTVAIRRTNIGQDSGTPNLLDVIPPNRYTILPNTAGCYTADDAVRTLRLARELARLDRFACLILDDIGYVQHNRDEMEVLFTFLAERYERRSVILTTNLVFSEWDRIFKDPMTTMAAIDRVVHHSVILDMMGLESYRAKEASAQKAASAASPTPA